MERAPSESFNIHKECLRKFVLDLLEQRRIRKLMTYPWVGLRLQVEDVLKRKAVNTDFSELFEPYNSRGERRGQANYYNVLYAFLLEGHDYAKAGEYMFRFAMRIEREADTSQRRVLQHQAEVLLLVISALKMAPKEDTWMLPFEQETLHPAEDSQDGGPASSVRRSLSICQSIYLSLSINLYHPPVSSLPAEGP